MNAIADALADQGASVQVQMPARPAAVWRALQPSHRSRG
jgi:hypothetical protein